MSACQGLAADAQTSTTTYPRPTQHHFAAYLLQGVPINFCPSVSRPAKFCDPIYAASLYCQRAGYDRATHYTGPVPANSTVAMQLMMNGEPRPVWNTTGGVMERCEAKNGKTCSTFGMIYCIHDKMFVSPMVDGKALDWCATRDGKTECGKAAADAFCERNGFSHGAWSFKGPTGSLDSKGNKQDTVSIDARKRDAPGKVCNSKQGDCQTFVSINCEL